MDSKDFSYKDFSADKYGKLSGENELSPWALVETTTSPVSNEPAVNDINDSVLTILKPKSDHPTTISDETEPLLSNHKVEQKKVEAQSVDLPSVSLLDRLIFKVCCAAIRFFEHRKIIEQQKKWEREETPGHLALEEQLQQTRMVRMMGGLGLKLESIKEKLEEVRLASPDVKGQIQSLVEHYCLNRKASGELEKLLRDPTKTDEDIAKFIHSTKEEGLFVQQGLHAFSTVLDAALASEDFKDITQEQREILVDIQQNLHEDFTLLEELNRLTNIARGLGLNWLARRSARRIADLIMAGVDKKSTQQVGKTVTSGWVGHLTCLEIEKKGGQYVLSVGNAGSGTKMIAGTNDCQSVRTFTLPDTKEGQQTLHRMLVELAMLRAKPINEEKEKEEEDKIRKEYYEIFEKNCTEIVDEGIEARPTQEIGNCVIRSQEELYYNKLQRLGHNELANKLQQFIHGFANSAAQKQYPALQEIAGKNSPPNLTPIRRDQLLVTVEKHIVNEEDPSLNRHVIYQIPSKLGSQISSKHGNFDLIPMPTFVQEQDGYKVKLGRPTSAEQIAKMLSQFGGSVPKVYVIRDGEEIPLEFDKEATLQSNDQLRWGEANNPYYEVRLS